MDRKDAAKRSELLIFYNYLCHDRYVFYCLWICVIMVSVK